MTKAANTRKLLLEHAFATIYENGFQAASIDRIMESTGVTKGAFYYHFKNKEEMGLAVINEVIAVNIFTHLVAPLGAPGDPLLVIHRTFKNFMLQISEHQLKFGCPTNNLVQEMAPLNEKFAKALLAIVENWKAALARKISEAQADGSFDRNSDPQETADFIIASYEGARALGKVYYSFAYYHRFLNQLKVFLNGS